MKKNKLFFLVLVILLALPILFGLFNGGLFVSDDGNWMVIRFSSFYEEFRNGQIPIRFLSRLNNGYGYPVANFLYPLFMYMGVPIHILGFSFVATIKIILGLSMIGSAVFAYLWLSKFFDRFSSVVGSLFYVYAPYHLYDLYKRGSVGEILAFTIAPFILWQIERKSLFWSSLGIAALILSHNSLAILFIGLIIFYMLLDIFVSLNRTKIFSRYACVLVLGLGGSSFFWIPAIYDLRYTVFSSTQVADWSSYFASINLIGLSTIFIILLTLFFIFNKKINIKKHKLTIMLFCVGIFSIFLSSSLSVFLWNLIPASFIQFPFRFLSITILCVSFLAACSVSVLSKRKVIIGIIIIVLTLFSSWEFIFPKEFQNHPDSYYSTNQDSTTVRNEYMPKWVEDPPNEIPKGKAEVLSGDAIVNKINVKGSNINIDISATKKSVIKINVIYFPGWEVNIGGKDVEISYANDHGLIYLEIPEGQHKVQLNFKETGVRLASDLISAATVLGIALWWLLNKKIIINKSAK